MIPDDVLKIALGALQGLASSTVFVLVLFIGFCVVFGFLKTKTTAGGNA
jgi:preprotein translocase subunit SecG